ncbi:MAG: dockerin type I domain-containing protein [Isosphaeraceae bacterium]
MPEESGRPADTEGEGSGSGHGGGGGGESGGGETTPPPVYVTQTDADGRWSITELGPGTYSVTVSPPALYGIGADTASYSIVVLSGQDRADLDFGLYPLNQAPVNTVPAAQVTDEDVPLVFSTATGNAITVSDTDAGTDPVEVTLSASHGTLTLKSTADLTFATGDGAADASMKFTGTIGAINAALDGLRFETARDFVGAAGLSVTTNDLGNHGLGGPKTDTRAVDIAINAVADPATLEVSGVTVAEGAVIPLSIKAALTDTGGGESLTIKLHGVPSNATPSAGRLTDALSGDWTLSPDDLNNLSLRGTGSGSFRLLVTAVSEERSDPSEVALTERWVEVRVTNVAPTITAPAAQTAKPGVATAFSLGAFTHPSVATPCQVKVDWGDGTSTVFDAASAGSLGQKAHAYATTGRFQATVTVRDHEGASGSSQFSVVVGPTRIVGFALSDLTPQRSKVMSVNVAFSGPVTLGAGALVLRDAQGRTVPTRVSTSLVGGKTLATLTIVGYGPLGNSLPDGRYTVTVVGGRILDAAGRPVDAAGTGSPGSSRQYTFLRRFGDVNGDGRVNDVDLAWYRYAGNSRVGQANYLWFLDANGDGRINSIDAAEFLKRYRR